MAVGPEPLVVWVNGAFGVGKTSVAEALVSLLPGAVLFDPEQIGTLLREVNPRPRSKRTTSRTSAPGAR